jgi:hypothetical protein
LSFRNKLRFQEGFLQPDLRVLEPIAYTRSCDFSDLNLTIQKFYVA